MKGSDDLKIRPISDMVNHFSDIKIAEYISKDFSNFSKVFDFGDLLESSIVNPNSLAGMEMIYLACPILPNRQDIASTINKTMRKRLF